MHFSKLVRASPSQDFSFPLELSVSSERGWTEAEGTGFEEDTDSGSVPKHRWK